MTTVWNAQRVSAGLNEIEIARPAVLGRIKQLLDDYHGNSRSARYYDILLGDWCERFLHLVFVATQDLASESTTRNEKSFESVSKSEIVVASDTLEFFTNYQKLPESVLATLRTLIAFGPTKILISGAPSVIKNSTPMGRRNKVIAKVLKIVLSNQSEKVLFVRPFSGSVPTSWVRAMISWRLWAKHDDLDIKYAVNVTPDKTWRQKNILEIQQSSSLSEVSNALISAYLPLVLVEGYGAIRTQVLAARPNRPRHLYSSQSLWAHLEFKVLAAEWCEHGTKLHYHQHGGWYGLDELHVGERYECRVSDTYFTWGWSRGDKNTRPLSPVTPRIKNQKKLYDSLICFDQPQQIYRLQYFPLPGTLQTMYDQVAEFVKLRNSDTQLNIRLFPGEYGSAQYQKIISAKPGAKFDKSLDIVKQYFDSRIVIHSYLGTTWLETLSHNIPTVCFYDPESYRFRPDAKSLIDALANVGILHISGRSAAEHLNQIDGDVETWWMSEGVQSARRQFTQSFANFSSDWKSQWEQEFARLLKS